MRTVYRANIWPKSWHILGHSWRGGGLGLALLVTWLDAAQCFAAEEGLGNPNAPRKLELGLGAAGVSRPSQSSDVDYTLGVSWSGHATVVLLENLGLRLTGGMEYHDVKIGRDAKGALGPATSDPSLRGPHVMGQLQPMLELAPRLDAFALVGIGWQRFTAAAVTLGEPTPLTISERSGVLVELPVALGARYALLRERMALALSFAFSAPLTQSGALFDAGAGTSQSLRQDTGELVRVDALPQFGSALSAGMSLDFFF